VAKRIRVGLPARAASLAHRLLGDDDATLGQQLLAIAVAAGEGEVQPDGVRDDFGREPMALVAGGTRLILQARRIA